MKLKRVFIFVFFLGIVCVRAHCLAETINFEVTVDRARVELGQRMELGLVFRDTQDMPVLELPDLDGLQSQYLGPSTSMMITNGKVDSSITHVYSLVALRTGTYTVGPLNFEYQGNTYSSNAITIEVVDSSQGAVPGASGGGSSSAQGIEDKIFLVLEPAKTKVYLNEKVGVILRLLVNGLSVRDIEFPVIKEDGFFIAQYAQQPVQYRMTLNGIVFDTVEFSTSLFGLREGEFTLGPAELSCNMLVRQPRSRSASRGFGGFFDAGIFEDFFGGYERYPLSLSSNAVDMQVLPLPAENRPASFDGAVGSFHFNAQVSPTEVKAGDPITVRMTIIGSGNFNTVNAPRLAREDGFKVYEPRVETDGDRKIFEQVLMPMDEGIREIPALSFSYFDPERGVYETISQGPFLITVAKPEREERLTFVEPSGMERVSRKEEALGRDIVFIKSSPGSLSEKGRFLYRDPLFVSAQALPLIFFLFGSALFSRTRRLRSDIRYARHLQAPRKARKGIKALRAHLRESNPAAFYDVLYGTLRGYLGDRFHLSSAGLTASVVDEVLKHRGIKKEVLGSLRELFNECDMARYAPSSLSREDMRQSLTKLEETIDYLQRHKHPGKVSGAGQAAAVFLFCALLFSPAYALEPPEAALNLFYQANAHYQQGAYAEAAALYERILSDGYESGNVYYNLGNSYVKLEDYGRAVVQYERAAQLMPEDADLKANYAYVRTLLNMDEQKLAGNRLARLNERWWGFLTIDGLTITVSALYLVLLVGIFVRVFFKRVGSGRWFYAAAALWFFVSAAVSLALVRRVSFLRRAGVVVVREASARFEPQDTATVHFALAEGTLVELIQENAGWLKIRRGDGKAGWIPASAFEKLDKPGLISR